jgi:ribonuclease HII
MTILAGIDEAGYGPLLGPLVVSSAVFRVDEQNIKSDMWHLLNNSVSQTKKSLKGRFLITDSKKAYSRSSGIFNIRRTVIGFIKAMSADVDNVNDLVKFLSSDSLERLKKYKYYANLEQELIKYDKDELSIAVKVLLRDLKSSNIELVSLCSRCLDVGYYNNLVEVVKNKASVLFSEVCSLINDLIVKFPNEKIQIIVDRQGGRSHYRQALMDIFVGFEMTVLKEDERTSSYEMINDKTTVRIHFTTKADDRFLPAALASMTSKYLREELVDAMNRYFISKCPDLQPTAGYWQDGTRFIADLEKYLPDELEHKDSLVRSR